MFCELYEILSSLVRGCSENTPLSSKRNFIRTIIIQRICWITRKIYHPSLKFGARRKLHWWKWNFLSCSRRLYNASQILPNGYPKPFRLFLYFPWSPGVKKKSKLEVNSHGWRILWLQESLNCNVYVYMSEILWWFFHQWVTYLFVCCIYRRCGD